MSRQRITRPTASLDLIAKANGQKTGDELRTEKLNSQRLLTQQVQALETVPLTARQRYNLRKVMAKAGKDIFGRPLDQNGGAA